MSLGKNPEKTEKGLPQSKYPSCKADIASYEGSRAPTLIMSVKSKKEKTNMKKTKAFNRILSAVFCLVLIAAAALTLTACKKETDTATSSVESVNEETASKVGDGKTEFAFRVTDKEGNSTEFIVCTDKTIVGEALLEAGLIEGEEGQFGLFVKKVNGIVADYDIDKTYWAFYVDGEYGMTGVDQTEIEEGRIYEFRVSK